MFPSRRRMLTLALAVLAGLSTTTLAACGDGGSDEDNLLPAQTASRLQATLDEIEQTARQGDCETAGARADAFAQDVKSLRRNVNSSLRAALASGADRLQSLVGEQCEPAATAAPPAAEPPAETVPEEDQQRDEKKKPKKPKPEDEGDGDEGDGQGDDEGDGSQGGGQGGGQPGGGGGEDTGGVTP